MSRTGSFRTTADLLRARIREAGEARGFAATRVLTHWAEIVGEDTARLARPKDIRFGKPRGGTARGRAKPVPEGATLILEVAGPAALRLEMEKERIRERVNAAYGYAAIATIKLVQMGPLGFSASAATLKAPACSPGPEVQARAAPLADGIGDTELRLALAALAANVLAKSRR